MHFNPDFLTSDAGSVSTGAGPAMSMEDRVLLFKQNLRPVNPSLLNTMYFQVCLYYYSFLSLTNIASIVRTSSLICLQCPPEYLILLL